MKEAAVQRRHNLYRDSIVLSNSDPNLHLLGESPSIDWAGEFGGGAQEETEDGEAPDGESQKKRRMKQVVSMIQVDDPVEKGPPSPGIADIPEERGDAVEETSNGPTSPKLNGSLDGSVSKAEGAEAEEQGEDKTAAESRPVAVPPGPEEPPSSQEVLEEELPPPPPEEVLCAALETSSPEESPDFPPPPHDDDSGFQSPTAETEEGQSAATTAAGEATASS